MTILHPFYRRAARVLAAAAPLMLLATAGASAQQLDPKALTVNASAKMALFALTASATELNAGLNLNGFADGKMTLTVPVGWKVVFYFHNKSERHHHHAEVIADAKPLPGAEIEPAFKGAQTGRPGYRVIPNGRHTVRFTADTPGNYLIFCGTPGHGQAGMYVRFVVSPTATEPTVTAG